MSGKFSNDSTVDVPSDGVVKVTTLPEISGLSPTYFVALQISDASGKQLGSNFYWLSTKQETIDWAKSTWYTTPTATYADFTSLSQLPKVKLTVTEHSQKQGENETTHVTLQNPSKSLAFFVRLKVDKGQGGEEILPVLWQDNYVSLLPGEKREITATYRASELGVAKPVVEVSGFNVE
jgi:exo-1,4-beta-D-glucosaminidase